MAKHKIGDIVGMVGRSELYLIKSDSEYAFDLWELKGLSLERIKEKDREIASCYENLKRVQDDLRVSCHEIAELKADTCYIEAARSKQTIREQEKQIEDGRKTIAELKAEIERLELRIETMHDKGGNER